MSLIFSDMPYLALSLAIVLGAGWSLAHYSRAPLGESVGGNTAAARALNRLLVIGFYLINAGVLILSLPLGGRPIPMNETPELLGRKLGWLLVVVGILYFLNICVIALLYRRARRNDEAAGTPLPGRR